MSQTPTPQPPLRALALVCSLKPSPAASSSELIAEHVFATLQDEGVACSAIRCVDYAIAPGVESDMGDGDQWPKSEARSSNPIFCSSARRYGWATPRA